MEFPWGALYPWTVGEEVGLGNKGFGPLAQCGGGHWNAALGLPCWPANPACPSQNVGQSTCPCCQALGPRAHLGEKAAPGMLPMRGGSSLGRARGRGPLPLWCCLLGCFPLRPVGLVSWGFLALLGGDVTSQAWRGPPAGPGPWTDTQLWAWKPHLDLPARHTHRTSIHAVSAVHV